MQRLSVICATIQPAHVTAEPPGCAGPYMIVPYFIYCGPCETETCSISCRPSLDHAGRRAGGRQPYASCDLYALDSRQSLGLPLTIWRGWAERPEAAVARPAPAIDPPSEGVASDPTRSPWAWRRDRSTPPSSISSAHPATPRASRAPLALFDLRGRRSGGIARPRDSRASLSRPLRPSRPQRAPARGPCGSSRACAWRRTCRGRGMRTRRWPRSQSAPSASRGGPRQARWRDAGTGGRGGAAWSGLGARGREVSRVACRHPAARTRGTAARRRAGRQAGASRRRRRRRTS